MKTLEERREDLVKLMKQKGITNFSIFKGPEWDSMSPEDRMTALEEIMKFDPDTMRPVRNIDGPPWFPMPQIHIDDYMKMGWKYGVHRVKSFLAKYAYYFDQWYQEVEWKVGRVVMRWFAKSRPQ